MKRETSSTKACLCAGIEVGKASLAYAIAGGSGPLRCADTAEGRAQSIALLESQNVRRVGTESTGGYLPFSHPPSSPSRQ